MKISVKSVGEREAIQKISGHIYLKEHRFYVQTFPHPTFTHEDSLRK